MRPTYAVIAALATAAAVPAAAATPEKWGPTWSEVTGAQYTRATKNRAPAIVLSIDGIDTLKKIVKVEPGKRTVRLQAPPKGRFDGTDQNYDLVLEPCKRYYLNAQFRSTLGGEWDPVVDQVERISGCKVVTAK